MWVVCSNYVHMCILREKHKNSEWPLAYYSECVYFVYAGDRCSPLKGVRVLWWPCLSVCLSVCLSARISQESHGRTSPNFLCILSVARPFSGGVAIGYVLPVLWMTPRVFFAVMGPPMAAWVCTAAALCNVSEWKPCGVVLFASCATRWHRCCARIVEQTDRQTDGRIAALFNAVPTYRQRHK